MERGDGVGGGKLAAVEELHPWNLRSSAPGGRLTGLTGTNPQHLLNRRNKNLTVTNLASTGCANDGLYALIDIRRLHHNFYFYFG